MKPQCKFEGCKKESRSGGYCVAHYSYLRRRKDPSIYTNHGNRKKIEFDIDERGCFVCTSHCLSTKGYPRCSKDGKFLQVSRFVYTEMFGEIPDGLVVRHTCDNRQCINPEHLILGTPKDNSQDMVERNRNKKGEIHPFAKLNEKQVMEIKEMLREKKLTQYQIADLYSVTRSAIQAIHRGVAWKHLNMKEGVR